MSSQPSMPVTIPATKAHRKFGELVRRVFSGNEHFIVEKDGLPVAAIVSIQEYEAFMKEREHQEQKLQRFRKLARKLGQEAERQGLTEEQLMKELEEDQEAVYQELYGDNQ